MTQFFSPTKEQLKVFSSVCSNLVATWFLALFFINDSYVLILDVIAATVAWKMAVIAENLLKNYDH